MDQRGVVRWSAGNALAQKVQVFRQVHNFFARHDPCASAIRV